MRFFFKNVYTLQEKYPPTQLWKFHLLEKPSATSLQPAAVDGTVHTSCLYSAYMAALTLRMMMLRVL